MSFQKTLASIAKSGPPLLTAKKHLLPREPGVSEVWNDTRLTG
jgi:hypothetical protein